MNVVGLTHFALKSPTLPIRKDKGGLRDLGVKNTEITGFCVSSILVKRNNRKRGHPQQADGCVHLPPDGGTGAGDMHRAPLRL